jgi:hypothetical protein
VFPENAHQALVGAFEDAVRHPVIEERIETLRDPSLTIGDLE